MKRLVLSLMLFMGISVIYAQTITYDSSNTWSSTQNVSATKLIKDIDGNTIIIGSFIGTVDFDFSTAVNNVISNGTGNNTFILKLSAAGNFIWVKTLSGSTSSDQLNIKNIIVNGTNIYIAGEFFGTIDFDPTAATLNRSVTANSFNNTTDFYIGKYDLNMNPIWVQKAGSIASDVINSFAIDGSGSVHAVGTFSETTDFDPGNATNILSPSGTGGGKYDGFYWKLNASGDFLKAFKIGGASYDDARTIIVDNSNILIMGVSSGSLGFGPIIPIINPSGERTYVLKIDLNHNYVSSFRIGAEASDLKKDNNGNLFLVGVNTWSGDDFDPSSAQVFVPLSNMGKLFLLKLNSSYVFNWVKTFSNSPNANSEFMDFKIDSENNLYTLGRFQGTADFDPGELTYNLIAGSSRYQTFIQKLNNDGVFVYAGMFQAYSSDAEFIYDMIVTSTSIMMVGKITSNFYVSPNSLSVILNNSGGSDAFLLNLNQSTLNNENFLKPNIKIYPNPTTAQINLSFISNLENAHLKIVSISGQTVLEKQNLSGNNLNFDVSNLTKGMYVITINDGGLVSNAKFIKE